MPLCLGFPDHSWPLHSLWQLISISKCETLGPGSHISAPALKLRYRQQAIIEAVDAGECAGGWFLQYFWVRGSLHYNQAKRAKSRREEAEGAGALLLAKGYLAL